MFEKGMNNFRSARDEHVEIENRWRILSSREAHLNVREKAVRERETEVRRFINANPPMQMAAHIPTPFNSPAHISYPRMPPPTPRQPSKRSKNIKNTKGPREDKDYAQFAVKPDNDTGTTKDE